jgi:hypothetical protein
MKSLIQILADIGSDAYSKQSGRKIIGSAGREGRGKLLSVEKLSLKRNIRALSSRSIGIFVIQAKIVGQRFARP